MLHCIIAGERVICWLLLMATLSRLDLLDQCLDGRIKRFHLRTNASTQFTGRQVDVQTGGFCAFVTGNERYLFEADPCSFEDGTALVTECVRGQRGKTHPFSDAFDDLVKRPNSQRTTW